MAAQLARQPTTVKMAVRRAYIPWWRMFVAFMSLSFVLNTGAVIESLYFPVLKNVSVTDIKIVPSVAEPSHGWLCFTLHQDKVRESRATFYGAELYMGDHPEPEFPGLEHDDHTPFGGPYIGSPLGHYDVPACVRLGRALLVDGAPLARRLGVRINATYHIDWRPWLISIHPVWIDAYKGIDY